MPAKLSFSGRATQWARDVVSGKVLACEYVRLACQRHLDDLKSSLGKDYPYTFDGDKGDKICRFAENMVHVDGLWQGRPIVLEDWQCFLLAVPFGWVRKSDGLRRFREIYCEVARKNSKSTLGAIIGLYMLVADEEKGAEVYAGATSEKQAMEVFLPAWLMVSRNPKFKAHFGLELSGTFRNPGPIYRESTASRFEAIIGKPGDGAAPSCAIIDEYHEHPTSEQYDTMDTGMGSRAQPMKVVITTAGTDTSVPCFDLHLLAIKVLEGTTVRDWLFTIVFTADKTDDWQDFGIWVKANPNLGVSVFEDFLRSQHQKALQEAGKQNIILCKHLDFWTNAGEAWMNMALWGACEDPSLKARYDAGEFDRSECWIGVDLASKVDIASLVMLLRNPAKPKGWLGFAKHYLPSATIRQPENDHYRRYLAEGWLTETEGARTDFHYIEDDLKEIARRFQVRELGYDPREAEYLMQNVRTWASFECVEIPQGPAMMSEPMQEAEAIVKNAEFTHPGDPCFTWMVSNVVKKTARGGGPVKYHYPTKQKDAAKIDAAVAWIMALGRAMLAPPKRKSVYNTEEMVAM